MRRRMLIGVLLTITSSLALPVALDSVSAPAGGSTPVSLADLSSTSVNGTVTSSGSGCGEFPQEFDASYAGSSNVGSVALHVAGCVNSGGSEFVYNGSFTVTTNVGTLSGSASGSEYFPCVSHTCLSVQLTLRVQSGSGSLAGTSGYLQFETLLGYPFVGGFSGAISVAVPTTTVGIPSNGTTVSGSTVLDASATNASSVEFRLFGGVYGFAAPVICTAKLSMFGWVCVWNSATVPNGSYALVALASNSTATAFSPGVNITVKNPPGQHRKVTA